MLLGVHERLVLLQVLGPVRGNLAELRILREFKEELSFNEEEHREFELRAVGDLFRWNPAKAKDKEIEMGVVARDIIVRQLRDLNERKVLTEDHLFIVEKFFPEVEEE